MPAMPGTYRVRSPVDYVQWHSQPEGWALHFGSVVKAFDRVQLKPEKTVCARIEIVRRLALTEEFLDGVEYDR